MSTAQTLQPPMAYLGGKTRISAQITALLLKERIVDGKIYDLCCGSGAVSLALLGRGVPHESITMVDIGMWGDFWRAIGDGTFDSQRFAELAGRLPTDPRAIHDAVQFMARSPVAAADLLHVFLIMQAASFGAKPVPSDPGRWKSHTFRRYWEPTATSNRRSHVNPMMPMPGTLVARVNALSSGGRGMVGLRADVRSLVIPPGSTVYIDPPYEGLTGYDSAFPVVEFARKTAAGGSTVLVSEAKALGPDAVLVASGRKKGGVSGERATANEEWVTYFRPG